MLSRPTNVSVLIGGGIDSAALVPFYLERGLAVDAIHFDYGQPSAQGERKAAQALCAHYGVPLFCTALAAGLVDHHGEYRCRNALLVLAAVSLPPAGRDRVALGIHAGVPYYDCSELFVRHTQRLLDGYTGGTARLEAPFITLHKDDIWRLCRDLGVPTCKTFSCERQSHAPCGQCPSCRDMEALRACS